MTDLNLDRTPVGASLFASFAVPGGGAASSGLVLSKKAQQASQTLLNKLKLLVFNNSKTGYSQKPGDIANISDKNITDKKGDPDKLKVDGKTKG